MNMEDRLKEAFDQEAEHLHAPHGSPETAIRRGRRRRASNLIGGAALVLALIGGTAAGVQLLGDSDEPAQENPASAAATSQTGTESTTEDLQSNTPVADFVWERVALPQSETAEVWNIRVLARDDGFVAVGTGFVPSDGGEVFGDGERVFVWESDDGTDWTLAGTTSPFTGPVDTLFSTQDGFVAVVRSFEGSKESMRLYSSVDGFTWTEGDADLGAVADNQFMWFAGATSGNGATVLAGVLQTEPEQPPVVLEEAGVMLQQNMLDGTFTVSDLTTGASIAVIDADVIYGNSNADGPTVSDDDGEMIVVIPWEFFDEASARPPNDSEQTTIEWEGIRLELDYNGYTYIATDIATGEVVSSGSQDLLYRPPRIQVTDPDTGELVVDISIDEYFAAEERSYNDFGEDFYPETDLLLLTTTDGTSWDRVELGSADTEEMSVNGVGYGPNGFILSVDSYGPNAYGQDVWRSSDGRTWELAASTDEPRQGPVVGHGDGYYSISYGRRGQPAIVRSTDGVNWATAYQGDSPSTYFNHLASGELGLIAIGQEQDEVYLQPLTISKDGLTMVLDYNSGGVTVTEDATGEVLTTIDFDIYDEEPPDQFLVDEETGTLTLADTDGTVLMVITEEEGDAASVEIEEGQEFSIPATIVGYSPDGDEWFTTTTVGLDVAWAENVAVGKSAVVIVGESADFYAELESYESSGEITIELGDGEAPATTLLQTEPYGPGRGRFVWVGRPT